MGDTKTRTLRHAQIHLFHLKPDSRRDYDIASQRLFQGRAEELQARDALQYDLASHAQPSRPVAYATFGQTALLNGCCGRPSLSSTMVDDDRTPIGQA